MSEPTLTVLGVYKPQISAETWKEQLAVTDDEEFTRDHFDKLVLMEFDFGKFGQRLLEFPNDQSRMMVGYDEALLSPDGETLIERQMNCVHGTGALRFAAYLHLYDPTRPLRWQCGEVLCPPIQDAPVRLMLLMPYNACS